MSHSPWATITHGTRAVTWGTGAARYLGTPAASSAADPAVSSPQFHSAPLAFSYVCMLAALRQAARMGAPPSPAICTQRTRAHTQPTWCHGASHFHKHSPQDALPTNTRQHPPPAPTCALAQSRKDRWCRAPVALHTAMSAYTGAGTGSRGLPSRPRALDDDASLALAAAPPLGPPLPAGCGAGRHGAHSSNVAA